MKALRIHPTDTVRLDILLPDGSTAYTEVVDGDHTIQEACDKAYRDSSLTGPMQDYVFAVTNESTGVSERYFCNAGGHMRLLE